MKKYVLFALTLVLTAALFAGCGCTNQDMEYTSTPTSTPTIATTAPTTQATTRPTTQATTAPTIDRGNGPLESTGGNTAESTTATEGGAQGGARQVLPNMN